MNRKVQVIRCLSIIAVVMIHTYNDGIQGVILRPFINFAVALFLFLSGYLTDEGKVIASYKQFCKKRILKVLAPYVIWSAIYTIAYGNYQSFLKNLVTFSTNGTHYYIFVYIQMVIITPVLIRLLNTKWKYIGFVITLLSIVLIRYIAPVQGWILKFPFTGAFGGLWLLFYYLGLGLKNKKFRVKFSQRKLALLYGGALILSIAEGMVWFRYGNYDLATTQLRLTSILTSSLACLLAFLYLESKRKVLTKIEKYAGKIGDCSFGIYLSHMLIISVLGKIPGYGLIRFPVNSLIVLLASFVCVVVGKKFLGTKYAWYMGL